MGTNVPRALMDAARYSQRDLDAAIAAERERCAKIAEIEEARYRKRSRRGIMEEDVWGANVAKEIAAAIRDDRTDKR